MKRVPCSNQGQVHGSAHEHFCFIRAAWQPRKLKNQLRNGAPRCEKNGLLSIENSTPQERNGKPTPWSEERFHFSAVAKQLYYTSRDKEGDKGRLSPCGRRPAAGRAHPHNLTLKKVRRVHTSFESGTGHALVVVLFFPFCVVFLCKYGSKQLVGLSGNRTSATLISGSYGPPWSALLYRTR